MPINKLARAAGQLRLSMLTALLSPKSQYSSPPSRAGPPSRRRRTTNSTRRGALARRPPTDWQLALRWPTAARLVGTRIRPDRRRSRRSVGRPARSAVAHRRAQHNFRRPVQCCPAGRKPLEPLTARPQFAAAGVCVQIDLETLSPVIGAKPQLARSANSHPTPQNHVGHGHQLARLVLIVSQVIENRPSAAGNRPAGVRLLVLVRQPLDVRAGTTFEARCNLSPAAADGGLFSGGAGCGPCFGCRRRLRSPTSRRRRCLSAIRVASDIRLCSPAVGLPA